MSGDLVWVLYVLTKSSFFKRIQSRSIELKKQIQTEGEQNNEVIKRCIDSIVNNVDNGIFAFHSTSTK